MGAATNGVIPKKWDLRGRMGVTSQKFDGSANEGTAVSCLTRGYLSAVAERRASRVAGGPFQAAEGVEVCGT